MASDVNQTLVTRLMCVHLLLMLYCRCHTSDVAHVQSIMRDSAGDNKQSSCDCFIQLSTRYHKSSRPAESKSLLLPIVGSGVSVGSCQCENRLDCLFLEAWMVWYNLHLVVLNGTRGHLTVPRRPAFSGWFCSVMMMICCRIASRQQHYPGLPGEAWPRSIEGF